MSKALADKPIREQALDPLRSFIVQAPAGSGKTELLTQRYLRLLTTVEQPEQILAITFTRKAASEMRNRILQSLTRARGTPRPHQEHEAQNWDLAQLALQRDAHYEWQLESHPARLRIQTIDSLNAALAKRLPVLAGMGASMEIAQDQWPIYEAVCERLLRQLGDGSDDSKQLEVVLLHLANRVTDLVDMLCELLSRRDHWLSLLVSHRNDRDLRVSIEQTLAAAIEHHLQQVRALLPADTHAELVELAAFSAAYKLQDGVTGVALPELAALTTLPSADVTQLDVWLGLANLLCKKNDGKLKPELYAKVDKRQGFPADKDKKPYKERMQNLLADLSIIPDCAEQMAAIGALPAARFSDAQWQVLQALLQLLPTAVAQLQLEFQSRGQVDYVELSLRALQALGSPEQPTDTALALDARLKHVLVDEFQDTSITQMQLLNLLTAGWSEGDERTLFCVGDPMQSIYRFRQAEVGLFLDMQQHGMPNVALQAVHLQTNFRSAQPIVEWVNASFPRIMPAQDDAEQGAVHYSASQPRPDASALGTVAVHAGIDRTPQQEALEIRQLVAATLAADTQSKVAILVSGRSHVSAIANELKQASIAFTAVDIERLQDRSLVQDLIALTRALLHLGDRVAWLACLRAPWCGLSLHDLHAIVGDDAQQTIWSLLNAEDLNGIEQSFRLRRFISVMAAALRARGRHSLHDWVEQTWLALHGPACVETSNELQDAQSYFERLDELDSAGDLADVMRLEQQLGSLFAQSGLADPAQQGTQPVRVEIMTIHKSKGLEFDVVVLPSLHRIGGRDSAKLLRWTRIAGLPADGLVLAPPGAKGDEHDSIYQWLAQLEKQRAFYETQRLLYVAATRAKRELHLFGSVGLNKEGDAPSEPRQGSLLKLLWPQAREHFTALVQRAATQAVKATPASRPLLRRLPLDWSPPEPPWALAGQRSNTVINTEQPEFDWVGETARHIGTVVHGELEWLVKLPLATLQQWHAAARRPQLLLRLAELGVPEVLRDTACQRVIKAVEQTLQDAKGRWILGLATPHREAASEIALTGVLHGVIVNSVIDRSFVDSEGVRWIIDFKTSTHEGGGREEFLQNEVHRYQPQLQRYAQLMRAYKPDEPIQCALYFPLLNEWREVAMPNT